MYYKMWDKAIDTLIKHLQLPSSVWKDERSASMRFIARCYIELDRFNEAEIWYTKAIDEAPHLRDPLIELAILKSQQKEWKTVYVLCNSALKISNHEKTYINEPFSCEVVIPTPCWVSYPEIVRMAGGKPVFVEGREEDCFIPSAEALAAAITPRTKAFILTTPNNPNGCVWPRQSIEALAKLAVERDFYVVSDEIYEHLIYGGREHISISSLNGEIKKRTLLVNGVSKTYAMTGFRIGYVAGPRDVVAGMKTYQSQASSAPNTPAQHAAAVAMTMNQDCVEDMRLAFEERRDALYQGINAIDGLSCCKPEGAFYCMVNCKALLGKCCNSTVLRDSATFADALLTAGKVAVVPGSAFMAEGYFRMSYAIGMDSILEGVKRLAAFVSALD